MSDTFPDLMQTIDWSEGPKHSEACVRIRASGDVLLEVQRVPAGWRWTAYGWMGLKFGTGDKYFPSREAAKEAAVAWWGKSTRTARKEQERGRSLALAAKAVHGATSEGRGGKPVGSGTEPLGPESSAEASSASQPRNRSTAK